VSERGSLDDRIDFHPRLVERAVWAALRGRGEIAAFHRERDPAYALPDPDERDAAFTRLNSDWFLRLAIDAPVRQAIGEQAAALSAVLRILIAPVDRDAEQGAELYVASAEERSVVVSVRPEVLADSYRVLEFLRRELLHIADMLDPAFDYEPALPPQAAGPTLDRLLQDRYRVLWDCSVDGRLAQRGWSALDARERRRREFAAAFGFLGDKAEDAFARVFDGPRPRHPEFVAMATDAEASFGVGPGSTRRPGRCPLCGCPTFDFEPSPASLPAAALAAIRTEFPAWWPEQGLCPQCADLYRARAMSEEAVASLPGTTPAPRASR
jgi:hypothetical protein